MKGGNVSLFNKGKETRKVETTILSCNRHMSESRDSNEHQSVLEEHKMNVKPAADCGRHK